MAKKKKLIQWKKKKMMLKRIDNIPGGYSQQPRSSQPKRRTDFSLFFSNYSVSGSLLEPFCLKVAPSKNTFNSFYDRNSEGKEYVQSSLVGCSKTADEGSGFSSDSVEASVIEVELVNQSALIEFHDDREIGKHPSNVLGILDHTPKKSRVAESKALCTSPASVCIRHVEDLNQTSSGELVKSTDASHNSDEHDLSSDKSTLSVSSGTGDDCLERGRGKRERKPKIHFDDIIFPLKPDTKVRRLRIMRYLGLIPPVGSPF